MNKFAAIAIIGTASAVSVSREPLLTWAPTEPASHPINYPVPDLGMDRDIKDSLKHLKDQEAEKGTWTLPRDKEGKIISSMPSNNTLAWPLRRSQQPSKPWLCLLTCLPAHER